MKLPYSLRGDHAKKRFLKEYSGTKCVEHTVLLPGETRKCCCGHDDLEGEYYSFFCEIGGNNQLFFFAGPDCGRKLIEIGNLSCPTFFDPFLQDKNTHILQSSQGGSGNIFAQPQNVKVVPENIEMRIAISMLFYLWGSIDTKKPLYGIRQSLQDKPWIKPARGHLITLNNAIQKTATYRIGKMTLRQMFQDFVSKHNIRARNFDFQNLEKLCSEFEIRSYL
ncbi:MAG: hypothetical protein LBH42_04825 [Treponema sp.]|nr:hypothetical protein [Treponema sp.]